MWCSSRAHLCSKDMLQAVCNPQYLLFRSQWSREVLLTQSFRETNYVSPLYSCCTWRITVVCQSPSDCCKSVGVSSEFIFSVVWQDCPYLPVVAVTTWPESTLPQGIHLQSSWWRKPTTFPHEVVTQLGKLNSSNFKWQHQCSLSPSPTNDLSCILVSLQTHLLQCLLTASSTAWAYRSLIIHSWAVGEWGCSPDQD